MSTFTHAARFAAAATATALLTACTTHATRHNEGRLSARPEPIDQVYVYAFLDLMDDQFDAHFLREVRAQLDRSLAAAGVSHQQLWSATHPIADAIASNRPQEQDYGARYRLIVYPAAATSRSTTPKNSVRWVLMDVKTDRTLWQTTSDVETILWWNNDEDSNARASALVTALMTEWRRLGFLASQASPEMKVSHSGTWGL